MVFLIHEFYIYTRFGEMVQIYVLIQETDGNDVLMIFRYETQRG